MLRFIIYDAKLVRYYIHTKRVLGALFRFQSDCETAIRRTRNFITSVNGGKFIPPSFIFIAARILVSTITKLLEGRVLLETKLAFAGKQWISSKNCQYCSNNGIFRHCIECS